MVDGSFASARNFRNRAHSFKARITMVNSCSFSRCLAPWCALSSFRSLPAQSTSVKRLSDADDNADDDAYRFQWHYFYAVKRNTACDREDFGAALRH